MKVKYSLIPFIPITIAMIIFKVMDIFAIDGNGLLFGMDNIGVAYSVIALALIIFLFAIIFNIFDKKTAPVYDVKKNPIAGIFAVLSGLLIAASSLFNLTNIPADAEYYIVSLLSALMAVPAAVAMFLMCKVHFCGKTTISAVSILYIFPALWSCINLGNVFLETTRYSIASIDMSQLFCYVFLTLYFFSHSSIMSRIKGRNPVKACFIYGLPAAALLLTYGVYVIASTVTSAINYQYMLIGAQYIVLAVYIISFVTEMAFNGLTKNEVEIINDMPNEDETDGETENSYVSTQDYDDIILGVGQVEDETENKNPEDFISASRDIDDFIIGYRSDNTTENVDVESDKNNFAINGEFFMSNGDNILDSTPAMKTTEKSFKNVVEKKEEKIIEEPKSEIEKKEPEKRPKPTPVVNRRNMPQKPKTEKRYSSDIDQLLQELDRKK